MRKYVIFKKKLLDDANFESNGFMEAVNITDFSIRDHKVILKIRPQTMDGLAHGQEFYTSHCFRHGSYRS